MHAPWQKKNVHAEFIFCLLKRTMSTTFHSLLEQQRRKMSQSHGSHTQMVFTTNVTLKPFRWIQSKSALMLETVKASGTLVPAQFCLLDFENVQILANFMSLDVVDFTNYRLDHLPTVRTRAFVSSEMAVDAIALAKTERNTEFTEVCEDIPGENPIIHIFLDPELWREKGPITPSLSEK